MMLQHSLEMTKPVFLLQDTALTAGGTVSATSGIIDRFGTYTDPDGDFTLKYDLNTLAAMAILDGAIADGETLSLKLYLQTSSASDFSSDVNYVNEAGDLSSTAPSNGYAEYEFTGETATAVTFDDILSLKAYLKSCKRYLRILAAATFSATGTDTVSIALGAYLGDSQNNVIDTVEIKDVIAL